MRREVPGVKRFGVVLAGVLTAAVFAAAALADTTQPDGDITDTPLDPLAYGNVCKGQDTTVGVHVFINRNGAAGSTNVFKDGSTATVSVVSALVTTGTATLTATLPSAPGDQITLPSNWGAQANNTRSAPVLSSVTVNATSSGTGTITYRSTGVNSSNATIARDGTLAVSWTVVDCTPPVITPTVTPASPNGSNGWYKSGNVTVTFAVADAESAISSKSAACDATNTVSTDGTHAFTCTATSGGGTTSSTVTIERDATIPTATLNSLPASTTDASINVTGTATDATSGVDAVTVNGGAATFDPLTGAFSRVVSLSCGSNTITAFSTDKAGNQSADATASVTRICDTTPPTVTVTVPSAPAGQGGYFNAANGTQAVNVSASDPSNVSDLSCTVNGSPVTVGGQSGSNPRTGSFQLSADGTHDIVCTATDGVGNSGAAAGSSNTGTIKIDATAPVITLRPAGNSCSLPGSNGWCRGTQTAGFTATDATSGFDPSGDLAVDFSQSSAVNGAAVNISSGTKNDRAGNTAAAIDAGPFKIDSVAPAITRKPSDDSCSLPGNDGWCRGTQAAGFTATEATSGFAPSGALSVDFTQSSGVNGSAVNISSGPTSDLAGNTAAAIDAGPFKIDSVDPVITLRPAGDSCSVPGSNGWCRGTQTAGFTATDATSGFAPSGDLSLDFTESSAVNGSAVNVSSGTKADRAGNTAAAIDAGPYMIDSVAPAITRKPSDDSCSLPGNDGWCRGTQTAGFTATDATSGFAPSGDLSVDFAQSSGVNGSAVNISSGPKSDLAGNTAAAIDAGPFKIDSVDPLITLRTAGNSCSLPGSNGWCRGTQTAGFTATDATSGFAPSGDLSVDFTESSAVNGSAVTIKSGTKTDRAGNTAAAIDAGPFKIDSVDPVITRRSAGDSCALPGNDGWCRGAQTAGFTATDATSGFAPSGNLSVDFTQSSSVNGSAVDISSGTKSDLAGNTGAAISAGPFKIDTVAPTVTCPSPAPAFVLNQPGAQVAAAVTDATSGPLNATEHGAADTSSVGAKNVQITGHDVAGNSHTTPAPGCAYTVGYNFDGFFAPIDRPNTMNVSKAGQAIPLKWRLTDAGGNPVLNLASAVVSVTGVSCALGSTTDLIEEVAAGSSGLQNLGDGYYQINWKSPTSYAGSCKTVNLNLGEGTTRTNLAYISFKK